MSANDEKLRQIISAKSVTSFDDVISVLQSLDREISSDDGLKWFNLLYLKVTEEVRNQSATLHWENAKWLERLDVIFAKLYLAAIAHWHDSKTRVARAWLPLFELRKQPGIMRVQFAFAGINAHINHDLPIALVAHQSFVTLRKSTAFSKSLWRIPSNSSPPGLSGWSMKICASSMTALPTGVSARHARPRGLTVRFSGA
jgi:hypothetical protein